MDDGNSNNYRDEFQPYIIIFNDKYYDILARQSVN